MSSSGLEKQDCNLAQVEVNEVLGLMGHVRAEVAAHDAMPGWVVLLVKLFLDESRDVLLDIELFEGLSRNVDCVLLHVLRHVSVLYNCFAVCHLQI